MKLILIVILLNLIYLKYIILTCNHYKNINGKSYWDVLCSFYTKSLKLVCTLHLKHISVWTSHSTSAQKPFSGSQTWDSIFWFLELLYLLFSSICLSVFFQGEKKPALRDNIINILLNVLLDFFLCNIPINYIYVTKWAGWWSDFCIRNHNSIRISLRTHAFVV